MPIDAWLPVGFSLSDVELRMAIEAGDDWQIWDTQQRSRVLLARATLVERWQADRLLEAGALVPVSFGSERFFALLNSQVHTLAPLAHASSPNSKSEALAFATALRASRATGTLASLHDSVYVEKVSRLLPTYTLTPAVPDDLVFGTWLSGGVLVSTNSIRRLRSLTSWLGPALDDVIRAAGLVLPNEDAAELPEAPATRPPFELAGRAELAAFFREHIIDIVENENRYRALGVEFPSGVVLHGPPGSGKTFAIERLIEHLGWPSYAIDASSVASPYIHDTSRKVAAVFDEAVKNAPSVLVIDEMEGFLADRQIGSASSHHRVEEVGEFLRRIPDAIRQRVLVVAMTNRLEMIDPALLRRGRFDNLIEVPLASRQEVETLLTKLLSAVASDADIDTPALARGLAGRPLSDVAFVVREAGRLAARKGNNTIDSASLFEALGRTPARTDDTLPKRDIGFRPKQSSES